MAIGEQLSRISILLKMNYISTGLQCVVSADLPYCMDIDECMDTRPDFNKADTCGDHAVLFDRDMSTYLHYMMF